MSGSVNLVQADGVTAISSASPLPVALSAPENTRITATSGNEANTVATATLAAASGKTTYITGFEITASGATSGLAVTATVSDGTWTLNYAFVFPAGVLLQATPLVVEFPEPIPASAADTTIAVSLPASGTGGTHAAVNAHGFQQ
jgi:hypothetical protein